MKNLILFTLLLLVLSCKNEKRVEKPTIDLTRLNDKVYIDSLEKSAANFEEFKKLFKDVDLKELLKNKKNQKGNDEFKQQDDLMIIANRLRDTTEYGLEKIIELQTGEKVKLSELEYDKHFVNEKKENPSINQTSTNISNKPVKKEELDEGLKNLKNQYGLEEESMLVELLRSDSHNTMYNPKNTKKTKQLLKGLQNTSKEETTVQITNHLSITKKELEILKKLPNSANIRTEKKALNIPKGGLPNEVLNHIKSGNATERFVKITNLYKYAIRRNKKAFISKSKLAKTKFKKLNPTWYSSKHAENSYMDSKSNMIYLPLGKLSFADKVISHQQGNPKGNFANGSLGEPNIAGLVGSWNILDNTICNIGTKGVLTIQFIDNVLIDVNGPDLYIFEIGKIEPTKLEISKDGKNWIDIGKIDGGTAYIDIHDFIKPNDSFSYVRLTDLETYSKVPGADIDAIATIGGALRLSLDSEVLFETGKYTLKKEGVVAISKLASQIKTFQKGKITIEGHTDDVGSTASNQTLSKKRAHSVAVELKKIINSKDFTWKEVGYGESMPIVPNDNDKNRKKNRRVELLVIPTN